MKLRFPRIRLGIFTTLFLIFGVIALILLTPFSQIVVRLVPENIHKAIFENIVQQKTLIDNPGTIDKEIKITQKLAVLGSQTGICMEFEAGGMTVGQKKRAQQGKTIVDITAYGEQQQLYELKYVDVTSTQDKKTVICQQFGRNYSTTSDNVILVIIKPKNPPVTPSRIFWISTIDIFQTSTVR